MRLSFTRGDGRRHHITAVLDDKVVGYFAMADYGPALPHDIAHVAVESLFELPYGFWGLVAAGADFETLNRASAATPSVRRTHPLGRPVSVRRCAPGGWGGSPHASQTKSSGAISTSPS